MNRRQLLRIGLTLGAIRHQIKVGWLIPVHAGVYAVGYVNRTPVARACAAVLACGDRAALSCGSAATLWGFTERWDEPFEATVADSHRRREGIKIHRSRTLLRRDVTTQLGISVTSPARTMLDYAPRLTEKRLGRVVNDGLRGPYLHVDDLADVRRRNPNHPGAKRLVRFVQEPTNSPLEDDFVEFAKRYGLPAPVTNARLLMLEADYLTVRVTKKRMSGTPEREARRLNTILEGRRRRGPELLWFSQTGLGRCRSRAHRTSERPAS